MIGFKRYGVKLRVSLVVLAGLSLLACSKPGTRPERPEPPPAVAKPVQPEAPVAVRPEPPKGGEELTAPLLYDVLLGEIAGQRGKLDVSGAAYLEAARLSNDPRVAERALKISIYADKPQMALEAARRWVQLAPDNLEARQTLAILELRTGHRKEALQHFEHLLKQTEGNSKANPYQGMLVVLAREPDKQGALEVMGQLVAMRPGDPEGHFAYARLAVHAGKLQLADHEVHRSLELRPDWTDALILRAQIALKQGKSQLARQEMEDALERKPKDAQLRLAYARLLVDLEDFAAAREQYRQLEKLQPDNGQVIYSLALLALEAGQLDEARGFFEKLVKMDYQTQQAYYYLGAIAEEQKNEKRAMRWYRKVGEGDHWLEVQIRMAVLEARAGDLDMARERLRKLRVSHPAQAQRLFLVEGDILGQNGRDADAFDLYSRYLQIHPDDIEVLYARALVAERLDRLAVAESDFRRILKLDPDNVRTLNALGYTLADRTDRYQEALGYIEKAFAKSPDDPAVIDSMGWVLYRLGRLREARELLQGAYDMTGDGEIAAHLIQVMWAMGDKAAARALWKEASKKQPGHKILEETARRLSL